MTVEKQDSNNVGFFVARETTNRVLPGSPVWHTREPNSFNDFGGDFSLLSRRPFDPSRQRKKGGIVDLDANGGWTEDVTMSNMLSNMEAFCFAAARNKTSEGNVSANSGTEDFAVADSTLYKVGELILAKGFANAANNGIHVLNGLTDATHISTASSLVTEGAGAGKSVTVVGFQFPADDVVASTPTGLFRLASASIDCRTLGLIPGEWIFIGGDSSGNQLSATLNGYARIQDIDATAGAYIEFDKTTFTAAIDDGVGTTLRVFFGSVVRNESDPDLIVKYTHTCERTLGRDDVGRQSEYIDGFVMNELTWTSPLADKVNVDMKGIGATYHTRTGTDGPLSSASGSIIAALGEDPINTSSNVYRLRMAKVDPTTLNPSASFARVTEWTGKIKNNVTPAKAQGTLGAFDTTAGIFEVDMEVQAYFATVAPLTSLAANDDVTFDAIYAAHQKAIVVDFPLIALGGGRLKVEMDKPIMVPLQNSAAESAFGHTVLFTFFPYVPLVGNA